ncbi:hypothetical protein BJY24_000489 [Nocardia transvalensis]|uniref:Spore-associated protein A n=1 Tax=Nocardia transvalensis TaxID=37333 RepID=A0A7W9P900_9NOCA|nr:hypothetical protein [Nocardia transvalensis]MBB5911622.1 hypothetical protein [Nocardia transvalensis]
MINAKKTVAACVGALGISAAAAVFFPATASAAAYGGQCGGGYDVIDTHDIGGGTVFLTYNGDKNCVVTVRDKAGERKAMGAGVQVFDGGANQWYENEGEFEEYAGPVFVEAKGQCIDWGGYIGGRDKQWTATDHGKNPPVHCGR